MAEAFWSCVGTYSDAAAFRAPVQEGLHGRR